MYALSREYFDRPGPSFSSSTRSSTFSLLARKFFGSSLISFYSDLHFQMASHAGSTGGAIVFNQLDHRYTRKEFLFLC